MALMHESMIETKKKEIIKAISAVGLHGGHCGDAMRYALGGMVNLNRSRELRMAAKSFEFPHLLQAERLMGDFSMPSHRHSNGGIVPKSPELSFELTLESINTHNLESIMQGCMKESKKAKSARELRMAIQRKAEKKEADRKRYSNWEFGVSHPDMVDPLEIASHVSMETPIITTQDFRREEYIQTVKAKHGKEKEITKTRTLPVSEVHMMFIHGSLFKKAKVISHTFLSIMDKSERLEGLDVFYVSVETKAMVEKIIKLAKEVKHASFGDRKNEMFTRVVMRKI